MLGEVIVRNTRTMPVDVATNVKLFVVVDEESIKQVTETDLTL